MKLNKEEFLQSELGRSLKERITEWDKALTALSKCGYGTADYLEAQEKAYTSSAMWDVFCMALKHFYGMEYHFTRTDVDFGVCTEDESNWLLKIDRHTGKEFPVADVSELKVKNTADTSELQEGIAGLEALPLIKREPQMPEEKKKLVNLLMDFVEDAVNPMSDEMNKRHLVGVAEILAGLVN